MPLCLRHMMCKCTISIFPTPYLDFHATNRFAQLEHDEDQAGVNGLPAAGAGLLPVEEKHELVPVIPEERTIWFSSMC